MQGGLKGVTSRKALQQPWEQVEGLVLFSEGALSEGGWKHGGVRAPERQLAFAVPLDSVHVGWCP